MFHFEKFVRKGKLGRYFSTYVSNFFLFRIQNAYFSGFRFEREYDAMTENG